MFGGKVTFFKEDYVTLTDLAQKRIAAENRVSELTAKVARLKKENEEVAERNAPLEQEVRSLRPLKIAFQQIQREIENLKKPSPKRC